VAHVYTLANQISKSIDAMTTDQPDADMRFALREAGQILVQMVAPMMPHLGEECWRTLGCEGMVASTPWPSTDAALLVDNTMTLPVQVNGKKRADVTVPADADNATIEASVRGLETVIRALEGRDIRKIIIVPRRIVNVVG
jgi:leucyl-tRNA synthetase